LKITRIGYNIVEISFVKYQQVPAMLKVKENKHLFFIFKLYTLIQKREEVQKKVNTTIQTETETFLFCDIFGLYVLYYICSKEYPVKFLREKKNGKNVLFGFFFNKIYYGT
jgi:hypothetical protein